MDVGHNLGGSQQTDRGGLKQKGFGEIPLRILHEAFVLVLVSSVYKYETLWAHRSRVRVIENLHSMHGEVAMTFHPRGNHLVCVGFHEEPKPDYHTLEWNNHIILFDEKGYTT